MSDRSDETLVTIATFETELEASFARGALEAIGISALVPGEWSGSFTGMHRGAPHHRALKVFESDREGTQQLHVMNADGTGARRISYGEGRYATPVVVPPCVAIVAAGKGRHQMTPVMGGFESHRVVPLSLTFDHRAATGGEAARFLKAMLDDLALAQ